jgi:TDG/mug DNA glycosylase family protein
MMTPLQSRTKMRAATVHVLPDVLGAGLDLVFVGTAAGARSAADRAYYAHPGNRFWRTLHETGMTPRRFSPPEFGGLPALGIGLTDLCKTQSGSDHAITDFDVAGLRRKLARFRPRAIAFTSKKGGALWFGRPTGAIATGLQPEQYPDLPAIFVLPSPSGAAAGHWNPAPWHALGAWLRAVRES